MPEADEIFSDWYCYARDYLGLKPKDPLLPKTLVKANPEKLTFEAQGLSREHWSNAQPVREAFKAAFEAAGVAYYNPHLFRKTVRKWALKNCSQYEYKAVSQKLGHDHAMTTYNCYGNLSEDEQLDAISLFTMCIHWLHYAHGKRLRHAYSD